MSKALEPLPQASRAAGRAPEALLSLSPHPDPTADPAPPAAPCTARSGLGLNLGCVPGQAT